MEISWSGVDWFAVLGAVVVAQIVSTVWFVVLFGEPWAREYGAADKRQHAAEIPGYTYGVQVACTIALTVSIALLQQWLAVDGLGHAMVLSVLVSVGFCAATLLPGQAFLRRWRVAGITIGSQVAMILVISAVLSLWP